MGAITRKYLPELKRPTTEISEPIPMEEVAEIPQTSQIEQPKFEELPEITPPKEVITKEIKEATFPTYHEPVTLNKTVGNLFSPIDAKSPTEGGKLVVDTTDYGAKQIWKEVKDKYDESRYLFKNVTDRYPELIKYLNDTINKLNERDPGTLSTTNKLLLKKSESLLKDLAVIAPKGYNGYTVNGFIPKKQGAR